MNAETPISREEQQERLQPSANFLIETEKTNESQKEKVESPKERVQPST